MVKVYIWYMRAVVTGSVVCFSMAAFVLLTGIEFPADNGWQLAAWVALFMLVVFAVAGWLPFPALPLRGVWPQPKYQSRMRRRYANYTRRAKVRK